MLLLKEGLLVAKLHQYSLVVGPLRLNLVIQIVIFVLDLANLLIWQVNSSQHVWLGVGGASRAHSNPWNFASITLCVDLLVASVAAENIAHAFLHGQQVHALWGVVGNLFRLLLVVEVDVLLD